VRRAVRAGG